MKTSLMEMERVRRHTAPEVNFEIDQTIRDYVRRYAFQPPEVISRRIVELDREFDIERTLQTNASLAALTGIILAANGSRRWLALAVAVLGMLLLHATQGWCPP